MRGTNPTTTSILLELLQSINNAVVMMLFLVFLTFGTHATLPYKTFGTHAFVYTYMYIVSLMIGGKRGRALIGPGDDLNRELPLIELP